MEVPLLNSNNLKWSDNLVEMLSCSDVGDEMRGSGDNSNRTDTTNAQVGSGADNLIDGEVQGNVIAASVKDTQQPPCESTTKAVPEAVNKPQGTVILRGKKIKGEIDTTMVILKIHNKNEIACFKDNVILLSQSMT